MNYLIVETITLLSKPATLHIPSTQQMEEEFTRKNKTRTEFTHILHRQLSILPQL